MERIRSSQIWAEALDARQNYLERVVIRDTQS